MPLPDAPVGVFIFNTALSTVVVILISPWIFKQFFSNLIPFKNVNWPYSNLSSCNLVLLSTVHFSVTVLNRDSNVDKEPSSVSWNPVFTNSYSLTSVWGVSSCPLLEVVSSCLVGVVSGVILVVGVSTFEVVEVPSFPLH